MKKLFVVTALLEGLTGVALMAVPVLLVPLLVGAALDTSGGLALARVAAAGLLALGAICWLGRDHAGRRLIVALLLYNAIAIAVLVYASLALNWSGIGLWPAVALHVALALWCLLGCRPQRS